MDYNFREIEPKWQQYWAKNQTFKAEIKPNQPKYYVLDMFPYPSGAGLHVGHPLGYIASDIYSRYKRLKGFNVLHPMGYDAFGLPAEQYAIQTGQHPAITTAQNIKRYREQLDKIGFSFDWSREVRTSDPAYYKWTQWIFIQLFNSWYNKASDKAEPIETLIQAFVSGGTHNIQAHTSSEATFTSHEWNAFTEEQQQTILMDYRLAFLSEAMVNWCPALGTVLANDEVKDGLSERGGYPVEQRKMMQWSLRITAYSERLLQGLENIDWTDALKEVQRNWIGKSTGAAVQFSVFGSTHKIEVFTTRPDTIFGVSFMVLAPEHALVAELTTAEQKSEVEEYIAKTKLRSERDRMADVKTVSGAFTGAYVEHPFTGNKVPVYIADYVLAGYGTGAVMAVPSGDSRDWAFAKHFNLPIPVVIDGTNPEEGANESKDGVIVNSDFLTGLPVKEAIQKAVEAIEAKGIGTAKINYKLRDAVFSRQRYWGEPFPVYYKNGIPYMVNESELPVTLPEVDKYLPTEDGEPPLARATNWKTKDGFALETNTMPGWAGSSWYFIRYLDANNTNEFVSKEALDYWQNIDLYMGGAEHGTGHLLYFRFWTKFLYDIGKVPFDEPAKKLINQGMIQGVSSLVYTIGSNIYISKGIAADYKKGKISQDELVAEIQKQLGSVELPEKITVATQNTNIDLVENDELNIEAFRAWLPSNKEAKFVLEDGKYLCGSAVEKMSKSKFNVVTPDDLIELHGADALRLHEMFLGPIELHKPWNTKGIEGVSKFMRKLWRLFHNEENELNISNEKATKEELKALHKAIKKVEDDLERFSFNTCVSTFMVCVNELTDLKCNKREVLEPLVVLMASHAPHITEELWSLLGHEGSVSHATFPEFKAEYLTEDSVLYPVSFNGKMRFKLELPKSMGKAEVEAAVFAEEQTKKWLEGATPKKVIVVPGKIVNIVL